jgi:hypothetical protein
MLGARTVILARLRKRFTYALARRKFAKALRPTDVFLVSYPKSGTVWLAFMIANILQTDSREVIHHRTFTKHVIDFNYEYFQNGNVAAYALNPAPRLFSVHAPYDRLFPKVVYVLRDVRDVLVSYYHFRRLTDANFSRSLKEFVTSDDQWPCRWDEHVAGWMLQHTHPQLLVVRYEDIQQDPAVVLKRILDFAGIKSTDADISRAVEASQFERMRSLEEKYGVWGAVTSHERFVRRGKIGGYKDELDEESIRVIERKFEVVMRQVGYEPTHVNTVALNAL